MYELLRGVSVTVDTFHALKGSYAFKIKNVP
jgi:hypothetical protein